MAHTSSHSFIDSAGSAPGQAVGAAAIRGILARTLGARLEAEGGPAGVLGGAVVGADVGVGVLAAHGPIHRGGSGGNSALSPDVAQYRVSESRGAT